MARPRKFDPDTALDAVMRAFWQYGYHGASFDHLVKETGASRHGLYQAFGEKDRLLLSSLQRYEQTVLGDLVKLLNDNTAALPELKQFFERIAHIARHDTDGTGCLICNTQLEFPETGPVRTHIVKFFRLLQQLFQQCLERAQIMGQLSQNKDVTELSHYLIGLVHAISANAQSNPSDAAYQAYVKIALKAFE